MHSSGHATSWMATRRAPAATTRARRTGARTRKAAARRVRDPPSPPIISQERGPARLAERWFGPALELRRRSANPLAQLVRIEHLGASVRARSVRETFFLTASEGGPILALETARWTAAAASVRRSATFPGG